MITILLDENLPAPLKKDFSDAFLIFTVYDKGWQSKKNGALLQAIDEEGINFLMTADRNLEYQQHIEDFNLRLAVLTTYDNRYKTLQSKVPLIESALLHAEEERSKILRIDLRGK